jgi:ABC-2 type transport system ATP-binding protein
MKQTRAPADTTPVLSVQHLSKSYTQLLAVDDVSFGIGRREIVGLLRPNGAGKTTIINTILAVLAPTAGSIRIGSFDVARQRAAALARTNFAAVYATLLARYSAETVS